VLYRLVTRFDAGFLAWQRAGSYVAGGAIAAAGIYWMAIVASLIFAQKVLPGGERLTVPFAVAFAAVGISIAVVPDRVPGLTRPDEAPAMHMSSMK
jgi:hypothetical protein